jgi:hypothetical protein
MTNPQRPSASANLPREVALVYLVTATAVDAVASECSVDTGDGSTLDNVLYLGPKPIVGAQVLLVTFNDVSVVLGGTG